MSLVPPGPTSPIFERTQPLTPLTTKGKPWRLRVRAGPTARSGSRTKLTNDSKVFLVVTPESKRQSITRHQNIYQKQTTVSPSPPASYDQYGIKKTNVYETSLASLPKATYNNLRPSNHFRQQSVFYAVPQAESPSDSSSHWTTSGIEPEGEVYICIYKQRFGGLVVECLSGRR